MLLLESPKGKPKTIMGYDKDTLSINFVQGIKGKDTTANRSSKGYDLREFLLRHYLRKSSIAICDGPELVLPIAYQTTDHMTVSAMKLRDLYFRDDTVISTEKKQSRKVLSI